MSKQRWLYTHNGQPLPEPIRVDSDWTDAPVSTGDFHKFQYDNLQATDGTDISSRTKRREYMKRMGITDASDFKDTWEQAAKERERFQRGEKRDPALREAIGRIEYEYSKRRSSK